MVNLIQAFSVAMKHFLRGEEGIYYADLYPLIAFLPRYINGPGAPSSSAFYTGNPQGASDGGNGEDNGATGTEGKAKGKITSEIEANQLPLWYHSGVPHKVKKIKRAKTFDPEKLLPKLESDVPLRPARNPPPISIWSVFPLLLPLRWLAKLVSRRVREAIKDEGDERDITGKVKKPAKVESMAPLEITCVLVSFWFKFSLTSY